MLDLSNLTIEARPIVEEAATVYLNHTKPWFVGIIVHGSALKGGFISGCSDIDFQLYLKDSAFTEKGELLLELCLSIHRDLSKIDPKPFRYIQCYPLPCRLREDWIGPIPGAYHLIDGSLPIPEATAEQLVDSAKKALSKLNPPPSYVIGTLLEHGRGRFSSSLRLLCTEVWPTLYHVLDLQQENAIHIWCLPKEKAIELLPPNTLLGQRIREFYQVVRTYYPTEDSIESGLKVIECGVAFLQAAKDWWEEFR